MTRHLILALVTLSLTTACRPDDVDGDTAGGDDTADTDDTQTTPDIVGAWVSTGDDLAPLFARYTDYVTLNATFNADNSYEVQGVYADDSLDTFAGTYTVDLSTTPHGIVVTQTAPTDTTAEGIWLVEGTTLTYEVLQTVPDNTNCTPPTPEGGFGSTGCSYLEPGDNTQVYQAM